MLLQFQLKIWNNIGFFDFLGNDIVLPQLDDWKYARRDSTSC